MWYSNLVNIFISGHGHQHWYTCLNALQVPWNPQHRSHLTVVSATSASGRASSATFDCPSENISTQLWTAYATNTSHSKQEIFLHEYPLHWVLLHTKTHNRTLLSRSILLKHAPFWLLEAASEHAHARLLPRLSWSGTVLLPPGIKIKLITVITPVLLQLLAYLLTLPRICLSHSLCGGRELFLFFEFSYIFARVDI
jgi:hypothetical protein